VSYEQEADKQQQKIDNMKAAGDDEYVIKKQVNNRAHWLVKKVIANQFFIDIISHFYRFIISFLGDPLTATLLGVK